MLIYDEELCKVFLSLYLQTVLTFCIRPDFLHETLHYLKNCNATLTHPFLMLVSPKNRPRYGDHPLFQRYLTY